jgi:hypothetical protein
VFKRLIALMMVLSIFTATANATPNSDLKTAYQELRYALDVEWDQKDKGFVADQTKKFNDTVRELQLSGKLNNADMLEFIKAEVKDPNIQRDIEIAFSKVFIEKMSPSQAAKMMEDTLAQHAFNRGASWNGNVAYSIIVGLVVVALVVAAATGNLVVVVPSCRYVDVCETTCYYDSWGFRRCYDNCWTECR